MSIVSGMDAGLPGGAKLPAEGGTATARALRAPVRGRPAAGDAAARGLRPGIGLRPPEEKMPAEGSFAAIRRSALGLPAIFRNYYRLAPLLWLGGVMHLWSPVMVIWLALRRWPRGVMVNLVIGGWMLLALVQAFAALMNGIFAEDVLMGVRGALSFRVFGWVFFGLGIAAGAGWRLAGRDAAHWIAHFGLWTVLLGSIGLAAGAITGTELHLPTPLGAVLPDSEMARGYASVAFSRLENTLGEKATRLILFYPWAPALGTGSLAVALISTRAADWRWRLAGVLGGAFGVLFSWSRLAIAAGVLLAALLVFIRLPRWLKLATVTVGLLGFMALYVVDMDPVTLWLEARAAADSARAGSSQARELIYDKSWQGFLQSPWIGHGWTGESVHRIEDLPIGSHSTIYGLLYTAGAPGLAAFGLAMAVTLAALVARLSTAPDEDGRRDAVIGLCLWLVLLLTAPWESLYSHALPSIALFFWIGGTMSPRPTRRTEGGSDVAA